MIVSFTQSQYCVRYRNRKYDYEPISTVVRYHPLDFGIKYGLVLSGISFHPYDTAQHFYSNEWNRYKYLDGTNHAS